MFGKKTKNTVIQQAVKEKPKKIKEPKKPLEPHEKASYKMKQWFFGLGKEFRRITWPSKNRVFREFCTVLLLSALIAIVFLGIDTIVLSITMK